MHYLMSDEKCLSLWRKATRLGHLLWEERVMSSLYPHSCYFPVREVSLYYFHQIIRLPVCRERVILIEEKMLHDFTYAFRSAISDRPQIFAGGDRICDISDCVIVCPLQTVERSGTKIKRFDRCFFHGFCKLYIEMEFSAPFLMKVHSVQLVHHFDCCSTLITAHI